VSSYDYFLNLKNRVEFDCLPDSELKLPDIYVPSALKGEDNQEIAEDLETYLQNWLNEAGQRQLALLGEYGQGKSTGTLMFSHHLVQQYNGKPPRIPILVELRGKSPKTLQPLELLSVWASNYRIDPKALMKLQQAGRLLLIFEGFDEMAEVSDSEAHRNHFCSLWKFCYPKAKILMTGRPNFFLDTHELRALLGIDQSTATSPYVQALYLQFFSQAQIEASLRTATAQNRQEISQLAAQDDKFYDIVARPSLLYIVNQLWDKSELRARQQDVNSALVIGLFIQHSYKRQTEKIRDGRQFMVLNEAERSYFMDGIAAFMAKEKLPNQITLDKFNQIVEQLYAVIPEEFFLQGNALSGNTSRPLSK
jgi:predicted NACHT family NTPase